MKTKNGFSLSNGIKAVIANFLLMSTLAPALASASQDYCEAAFETTTSTGTLTRRTIKSYAELDLSDVRDGVIQLSTHSVKIEGIPQLPKTLNYTVNEFGIRLERNVDRELRVNHIYLSSPLGDATFQLVGGTLIENLLEIRLDNDKVLEGMDRQRLTLKDVSRLLGFSGELKQVALKALQSECTLSQDATGTRLLQGIIRKFDKPAPHRVPWLGCPPCELERALQ